MKKIQECKNHFGYAEGRHMDDRQSQERLPETRGETNTRMTPRNFGSPTGMKAIAFMMRVLPGRLVYWIAMIPVVWYYITRSEGRRSSEVFQRMLGLSLGPIHSFFFGLRQARAFSRVILDNMYLGMLGPKRFRLNKLGTDVFRRALKKGRGLILLSAHVGNWHLAVNYLGNIGTRVHLVIDDVRQEEVKRQMDMAKEVSEHLVMHDALEPDLVFELRAALKRGEVVVLAGDRTVGERRVRLPFLGGEAWFPTTAFSVARATGAPICTAMSFRTGMQQYDCYGLGPFGDEQGEKTLSRDEQIEAMAREFAGHLDTHVRRFPEQWFNFFDFWKDD
ncbi:MAG: lysophospholipid acyltransferase family protein [Proteobacteria bacterium]|nr:lysophospholipid acyltransferase family protein [Pseudomonadota bacterium]